MKLESIGRKDYVLIDANIFIEFILDQEKADECGIFLEKVKLGEIFAIFSTFNIDSVLIAMEREGLSEKDMKFFINAILVYRGLDIYSVTISDRFKAIENMKCGLDFEDSLTLQCAFSNGIKNIVSFDKHFDKIKKINRIEPREI